MTDDVSAGLQGSHDAGLLQRAHLGEDQDVLDARRECCVLPCVDLSSRHRARGAGGLWRLLPHAQGVHHVGADQVGVTRDHLHVDIRRVQGLDGRASGLLGRVQEGEEPDEGHAGLVGGGVVPVVLDVAGARHVPGHDARGNGQDTHSLGVQAVGGRRGACEGVLVEVLDASPHQDPGADLDDLGHGALGDQEVLPVGQAQFLRADVPDLAGARQLVDGGHPVQHDGEAAAFEVEGDLVHDPVGGQRRAVPLVDGGDDGVVEGVAHARGVHGVEVARDQRQPAGPGIDVEVALQDDAVLGERPGLVGAQHVHGAQVLDDVGDLDDDLASGHETGPPGQVRGDDRREHRGCQPHRDGDGEEQGLQPVAGVPPVEGEDDGGHDEHDPDEQHRHPAYREVVGGVGLHRLHRVRHGAEVRLPSGGDHHPQARSGEYGGPHEAHVARVEEVVVRGVEGVCGLVLGS